MALVLGTYSLIARHRLALGFGFAVVIRLGSAMYCSRPVTSAYLRRLDDIKLI